MTNRDQIIVMASIDVASRNAPAIHILSLTRQLLKQNYDVTLIVPRTDSLPVIRLPTKNLTIQWTRPLKMPAIPNSLGVVAQLPALWQLRHAGPLYLRTGPLSFIVSYAARLLGYRQIIMEVNGWFSDELKSMGRPRVVASLFEKLQLAELSLASSIRVVTPGLKALLDSGSINEQKIHVIGNGTDLELFRPLDQSECRARHHLDPDAKYLIFSGNLARWQDLPTAFKAMPDILARHADIELVILGEGRERQHFEQEVKALGLADKVHFLGAQSPETVNEYLNAADLGIAPFSKQRNMRIGLSPLKIRDYAAAGLPIVTSDLPGLDSYRNESWISLVEPENADAFGVAITHRLDNLSDQHGIAARNYAQKHFSWTKVAQKIDQLICPH